MKSIYTYKDIYQRPLCGPFKYGLLDLNSACEEQSLCVALFLTG